MQKFKMALGPMLISVLVTGLSFGAPQNDQKPPEQAPPRGQFRPGDMLGGTIVSVGVDRIEIKAPDGTGRTVMVNDQTHYRQGQQDIQMEDLKPGDHIFARGHTDEQSKQFTAAMVRRMTEEEMHRVQAQGGQGQGFGRGQGMGEGNRLGGEILSIDGNQLKVRTRMRGDMVVVVNDQTSFAKDGQPIALKDLKVGDRIFAMGKEADGKFQAERVMTGEFRRGGR